MSAPVLVRPATAGDAEAMVAVIREGFAPELLDAMIYGCAGMGRFIRDELELPPELCDRGYTVAERDGRVLGCVELRRLPGTLVLNYIAVGAGLRSSGVARQLLLEAIVQAGGERYGSMVLDVFTSNDVARGWYLRLGFAAAERAGWWSVPMPGVDAGDALAVVNGFPQAEASQLRFGFSQVDVTTPAGSYAVGRMGTKWFRLTQAAALRDAALLSTLRRLDPARGLLVMLPEGQLPDEAAAGAARLAASERMSVPIPELLGRLRQAR
ncbi:MAG TPA: GNAT family N-acetyltransferase [Longimicrobium sp.]|nr:GNAT family N-acetyltransferase [Longimicrobium sp.]